MAKRRVHLELMSKQRLVTIAREASERADLHARTSAAWRRVVQDALVGPPARANPNADAPEQVTARAIEILRRLPVDPLAAQHRLELHRELYPRHPEHQESA